jgi:SCY1-like protein 2
MMVNCCVLTYQKKKKMVNSCSPFMQYMNTLTYLSNEAFSSVPPELVPDLQRMLSANESFRPTAMDFTGKT